MNAKKSYKTPRTPIYREIESDLRQKVTQGVWRPGTMLPSRKMLAQEYGVDLRTLQDAIVSLLADGTLRAEDRRGTFVAEKEGVISAPNVWQSPQSASPLVFPVGTLAVMGGDHPLPDELSSTNQGDSDALTWGKGYHWVNLILRGLERAYTRAGGGTQFVRRYDPDTGQAFRSVGDALRKARADGARAAAIVSVNMQTVVAEEVAVAAPPEELPTVIVAWDDVAGSVPYINYDNQFAGYCAAQHLLNRRYAPLVFLDPFDAWWTQQRLIGARAAVRDAGLPPEALCIWSHEAGMGERPTAQAWFDNTEAGRALARTAIARGEASLKAKSGKSFGFIGVNDAVAYGFGEIAQKQGLRAGIDFGLIGFDDVPESRDLGLSTIHPPLEEMGEEAARLLIQLLQGKSVPQRVSLRSHLIARNSTCLPAVGDRPLWRKSNATRF